MASTTVTLITPTGWRPEAFKLCEKYMSRQTYKGSLQWIVISDDRPDTPSPCTLGQEYYVSPLTWKPGINTQRYNFDLAISKVRGDYVMIIEDDDAYISPNYIEVMLDFLKYADMVGECQVTYYSLRGQGGYKEMGNTKHASTCQTAFRTSYLPRFYTAVHSGNPFPDLELWGNARILNHKTILFSGMNMCVGMKGLKGRTGIGCGHTDNDFIPDKNHVVLKKLLGLEDSKPYIEMMTR